MTGRGGGIRQRRSRDGDTPPPPQTEGGVLATLCATPVPTRGARNLRPRAPGKLERLSKGGRVATLGQVPGSRAARWTNGGRSARICAPHPAPARPWSPRCFCSVRGQSLLLPVPLSIPVVTPQINSQRDLGGPAHASRDPGTLPALQGQPSAADSERGRPAEGKCAKGVWQGNCGPRSRSLQL